MPCDTQFRNTYLFALAVYHGRKPGPDWQAAATAGDSRITGLMKKVRVELHPDSAELSANSIKARLANFGDVVVEITAKGKKFTARVGQQKGSPQNPMTDDELKDKFRENASCLPGEILRVEEIIEKIDDLENISDITGLTRLLKVKG